MLYPHLKYILLFDFVFHGFCILLNGIYFRVKIQAQSGGFILACFTYFSRLSVVRVLLVMY
jgi:hypothetical protein